MKIIQYFSSYKEIDDNFLEEPIVLNWLLADHWELTSEVTRNRLQKMRVSVFSYDSNDKDTRNDVLMGKVNESH